MTWAPNVSLCRQWAALSPGKLAAPFAFATALLFGAAAQAQQFDYSAVLASQGRINGPVNAGGIVWQCNAKYCTTRGPWPVPGVKSCNALATIVGPLASYGYKGRMLSPSDMASCNGKQTTASQAPTNYAAVPGQQLSNTGQAQLPANPLGALFQNLTNPSGASPPPPGTTTSQAFSQQGPAPGVTIRTATLMVTGTGTLGPATASASRSFRAIALQVTGTGSLGVTGATFSPVAFRAMTLMVTGTGTH